MTARACSFVGWALASTCTLAPTGAQSFAALTRANSSAREKLSRSNLPRTRIER